MASTELAVIRSGLESRARARKPGPVLLGIDVPIGTITVEAGRRYGTAEVELRAIGDDEGIREAVRNAYLGWDEADRLLVVQVKLPRGRSGGGVYVGGRSVTVIDGVVFAGGGVVAGGSIEVAIRAPEGSSVAMKTTSGDLDTVGRLTGVRFESISGDARVECVGSLLADSTSGDVRAEQVGTVTATTVSGNIRVRDLRGTALLRSTSGDVDIYATAAGVIDVRTVSGDIEIDGTGAARRQMQVSTSSVSGRVRK
jgi:hypothetical protein